MKKEIEKRLTNLAIEINTICKKLDNSYISHHLTSQIIRISTSPALNYDEVQTAESIKDFIHKSSIVLKELKETSINLKLLKSYAKDKVLNSILGSENECDQLVAIFQKTLITARRNL